MEIVIVYLILISMVVSYSLIEYKLSNKIHVIMVFFVLIFISGIRWKTGTDWSPYYTYFKQLDWVSINYYSHIEYGYRFFMLSVKSIYDNYTFFLVIQALFVIGLKILIAIKLQYRERIIFVYIFLLAYLCNIFNVRQDIALSIVLVSYFYFHKNIVKFLICVFFASLFHKSALIGVLLPLFSFVNKKNIYIYIAILFAGLFFILKIDISTFLPSSIAYKYIYFFYDRPVSYMKSIVGIVLSYGTKVPFIIFLLYCIRKYDFTRLELNYIYIVIFGFSLSIISITFGIGMMNRLAVYFYSFELIVMPICLIKVRNKIKRNDYIIIFLVFFIVYMGRFIALFMSYPDLYYPYEVFFDYKFKSVY